MNNEEIANNNSDNIYNDINSDVNMSFLGNNMRIVHYNEFSIQNFSGEMIWAYFTIDEKDISVGWAGNNVDMTVIESFFNMN